MNQTNTFWFNEVTGESSWEDPRHNTWRPVTDRETGKVFYYHPETLDSTWQPPEEVAWKEVEEEDTQHGGYGFCSPLLPLPLPRSLKDASGHLGRVPFKLRAGFLIPPPSPSAHQVPGVLLQRAIRNINVGQAGLPRMEPARRALIIPAFVFVGEREGRLRSKGATRVVAGCRASTRTTIR